jgi:hypothetical protein
VVAIPLSFKSLEQGKYALELNWSSQKVGKDVVSEPGMKAVGLGNSLIEFPATFQSTYFVNKVGSSWSEEDLVRPPVRARSEDGLEMMVSLSFQYKLDPSSLKPLYRILGDHLYKDEFVRFARGAVVEACSAFTADMFFTNRSQITNHITEIITDVFYRKDKDLMVNVKGLQLREVDLPDAFDAEISRTQEEMQEVEVALAEREEQEIAMAQRIVVAEQQVIAMLKETEGKVKAIDIESRATVDMMIELQTEVAQSNALILKQFANDADPVARLFELMEVQALASHDETSLLINM